MAIRITVLLSPYEPVSHILEVWVFRGRWWFGILNIEYPYTSQSFHSPERREHIRVRDSFKRRLQAPVEVFRGASQLLSPGPSQPPCRREDALNRITVQIQVKQTTKWCFFSHSCSGNKHTYHLIVLSCWSGQFKWLRIHFMGKMALNVLFLLFLTTHGTPLLFYNETWSELVPQSPTWPTKSGLSAAPAWINKYIKCCAWNWHDV